MTDKDAESFFLLNPGTPDSERQEKIEQYMRHFGSDPVIGPVMKVVAQKAGGRWPAEYSVEPGSDMRFVPT